MDNPVFVDEDIPLINQDEEYDDYRTWIQAGWMRHHSLIPRKQLRPCA